MESPLLNDNNKDASTHSTLSSTIYLAVTLISISVTVRYRYRIEVPSHKKLGDKNGQVLGVDDIPGPKPFLPIKLIGGMPHLLPFSKSFEKALEWHSGYSLIRVYGANKTFVGFNTPELVQQLLKSTDFGHGVKAPVFYDNMKPFITNGVLVSRGKFWQGQRKILMRSQSYLYLKAYVGCLNKHCEHFVEELETLFLDGKPHQINGTISTLFLKVICEIITGYNAESSAELDIYHKNFQMYIPIRFTINNALLSLWKESLMLRILQPWLLFNPIWRLHPMSRRQDKAVQEMMEFARMRIEKHKERRRNVAEEEDSEKSPFKSVLDELMDAEMAEDQILDEVNTMIFGGHETGATAIHFFCFLMALNLEIQENCRKEIDEFFENPDNFKNGVMTYEALQSNLRHVERCLMETLRLFPPVFVFLRELGSPLNIENENKTYKIPAGTVITIFPFGLQRDPKEFPDPQKFDPDRFLPEKVAERHAYSFIPFSAGQRNCLGQKFAMIEMKMVVAHLLRNFLLSTTDKMEDIPLLPFITPTPERDYMFTIKKRDFQSN